MLADGLICIDELDGLRYRISAASFYQVNPLHSVLLYKNVLDYCALQGDENVADAYCEVGTITLYSPVCQRCAWLRSYAFSGLGCRRTEAHLFISVLAYHLLISIETRLREQGDTRQWSTIKTVLSTHTRKTVILHGEENKVYCIRLSGQPEPEHRDIYKKMGVKDPLKSKQTILYRRL